MVPINDQPADGGVGTATPVPPKHDLLGFFANNPRIGLIGTAASVIGLLLAPVFFILSEKNRDIRYATSASPTTIVKSGQSSNLRVYYKDQELTSDVTSTQIVLWHDLRHTTASRLAMSGVDLLSISKLLGHKNLKMTMRYAHLSPGYLAEAVSKLVGFGTSSKTDTVLSPTSQVTEQAAT